MMATISQFNASLNISIFILLIISYSYDIVEPQEWSFQDGFCSHSPNALDPRYNIHSFAIAHDTLYIFAAIGFFAVPLGHPPYKVWRNTLFNDLSNELANNVYRTYRMTSYLYTSFAIEIDDDWEVFFLASELVDVYQEKLSEILHTQQLLRNRRLDYQSSPNDFPFAFNAYLGNRATYMGITAFNIDRFISSQGFVFHIQQRSKADNTTTNIQIWRYEIKSGIDISVTEYILHAISERQQNDGRNLEWFLDAKDLFVDKPLSSNFEQVMLKNGYIVNDTLYLTTFYSVEVYQLEYPFGKGNYSRIKVRFQRKMLSNSLIVCQTQKDSFQLHASIAMTIFFLVIISIVSLYFCNSRTNPTGRKFLVTLNGKSHELKY